MKNINIAGNVTKDAEVRNTPSGQEVCSFTIAVNDRRSKESYFFEVAYWGKAGTAVSPYIKKGSTVAVSGEFAWREYNSKKYLLVNASSVSLLGGKKDQGSDNGYQEQKKPSSYEDLDDDIPF
jgi:single-strand DNA-binding protein